MTLKSWISIQTGPCRGKCHLHLDNLLKIFQLQRAQLLCCGPNCSTHSLFMLPMFLQARWFFQQLITGLDYCHKVSKHYGQSYFSVFLLSCICLSVILVIYFTIVSSILVVMLVASMLIVLEEHTGALIQDDLQRQPFREAKSCSKGQICVLSLTCSYFGKDVYLLQKGVVSRDIKLENTLLDTSRRPLIKICDFGYSKHENDSLPKSKVGTPGYTGREATALSTSQS